MKPHKHAEVIKAWADGAEIEVRNLQVGKEWSAISIPNWLEGCEYRVKPPREFPKSSLSGEVLSEIYAEAFGGRINPERFCAKKREAIKAVADAAVKQHILDEEQRSGVGK